MVEKHRKSQKASQIITATPRTRQTTKRTRERGKMGHKDHPLLLKLELSQEKHARKYKRE